MPQPFYDIAVIGAGAAGLMAGLFAARTRPGARVVVIDGAKKLGAKILISGGGRCNVTHDVVDVGDFNGDRNRIVKVLRTFTVEETVAFFEELGVTLKREETGKLFPVSDRASTVLDALTGAVRAAGVEIITGIKVTAVASGADGFLVNDALSASRLILATGGRSVPKTGSDGSGYDLARSLGHTITQTFPALVPLRIDGEHWIKTLSGTSVVAELILKSATGRVLHRQRGSTLFTHFGLSGPAVLDISRHCISHQPASLIASFLPDESFESLERDILAEAKRNPHATTVSFLRGRLPERLIDVLVEARPLGRITKDERRTMIRALLEQPLPVTRDRGFEYAEVTAGGVPLEEVDVARMASRVRDGLYLCGEILDVDGRIGGYNFQWAWASGRLAGMSAASTIRQ